MLTLKDIKKTYKSKKGTSSAALKGVNIEFPDKGLVFILGKSGSGKSTLLNVVGGLDAPDSGEIIIKGKSSKAFTQKDYDSYRNTYLGFIFQEYNVMDDFSVYDNVALALRLQGRHKKEEKATVKEILDKVGLAEFERRKPNELSGGQKQRVAIARALVKSPEIIFGDEPTGNLDSQTSEQIFDILKELSKDKLVVIVSHDRDAAEHYADRIIELSDGLVISDITKTEEFNNQFNITKGEITIPNHRALNKTEIEEINTEMAASKGKVKLKSSTKNAFSNTTQVINNKKEGFKLIKSRLPNRFAASLGISNFKTKKFRLIITVFLTVVSLSLFGLSEIFSSYNLPYASASSFAKNNITQIVAKQGDISSYNSLNRNVSNPIPQNTIDALNKDFPNLSMDDYYGINLMFGTSGGQDLLTTLINTMMGKSLQSKFVTSTGGVLVLNENELKKYYLKDGATSIQYLAGGYPGSDNQVLITDYLADALINAGKAADYQSIVNDGFTDNFNLQINVSGIIDTGYADKYAEILGVASDQFTNDADYDNFANEAVNYYSVLIAGNKDFVDYVSENSMVGEIDNYKLSTEKDNYPTTRPSTGFVFKADELLNISPYTTDELYNGGTMVISGISIPFGPLLTDKALDALQNAPPSENAVILPIDTYKKLFPQADKANFDVNADFLGQQIIYMGYMHSLSTSPIPDSGNTELTVVGVIDVDKVTLGTQFAGNSANIFGVGSDDFVQGINRSNYMLSGLYITLPNDVNTSQSLLSFLNNNNMYHVTALSNTLYMVASVFAIFAIIFQWVALILGIFSVILLFNFISLSVLNKQKEIGILRAIGTKGGDVSKIFLIEAFIIAAITVVFAWALMFLGVWGINSLLVNNFASFLQSDAITKISLLAAGIAPLAMVLLVCVLITIIATIIPAIKISRMKPVDAIKKL